MGPHHPPGGILKDYYDGSVASCSISWKGKYHLDLIAKYGAFLVIILRILALGQILDGFEPFHRVLLCEGEDVDLSLYENKNGLSLGELDQINKLHRNNTTIDRKKNTPLTCNSPGAL